MSESLKLRVQNVPLPPNHGINLHVRVAVLFSGGLDCTVLARMAHDLLPVDQQIDLINVAFENPRVVQAAKKATKPRKGSSKDSKVDVELAEAALSEELVSDASPFEICPDRCTGRKAFQELQVVCPARSWRFVAVSITENLSKGVLADRIRSTCRTQRQLPTNPKSSVSFLRTILRWIFP